MDRTGSRGWSEITFDKVALDRLFESPEGPVAKDLVKRAIKAERAAKHLCPVDTGRLRASITWRIDRDAKGLVALIGTTVHYAAYIEFGTWRMHPRPFLRPAIWEAT
jgi:HK97 gp10 family phage protein